VKFSRIEKLAREGHSVTTCCSLFMVSSSGYYDWQNRLPSQRERENEVLKSEIKVIHLKSKKTYGSPRIKASLERQGKKISKDKVAKLMREEGLNARRKRAFIPKTTINNPNEKKAERLFKIENNTTSSPNEVWASDLTYIPTMEGFLYLVVVMDLFNREIKGWDLSDSMEAKQTVNAFTQALKKVQGRPENMIFHSDQGSQYCYEKLRRKFEVLGIKQSMSRKGNCYDNSFVESFFHSLKNELEARVFKTKEDARKAIFEYIVKVWT
jgi:putative transposase